MENGQTKAGTKANVKATLLPLQFQPLMLGSSKAPQSHSKYLLKRRKRDTISISLTSYFHFAYLLVRQSVCKYHLPSTGVKCFSTISLRVTLSIRIKGKRKDFFTKSNLYYFIHHNSNNTIWNQIKDLATSIQIWHPYLPTNDIICLSRYKTYLKVWIML